GGMQPPSSSAPRPRPSLPSSYLDPVLRKDPSMASIGAESSLSVVSHLTDTGKMPPGAPSPLSEGGAKPPRLRKASSRLINYDEADKVKLSGSLLRCMELNARLLNHPASNYFREPVDPIRHCCANYFEVIK
ncbi:hypothetical protein VYU27_010717, partial [Nannochloropsis oceanica]